MMVVDRPILPEPPITEVPQAEDQDAKDKEVPIIVASGEAKEDEAIIPTASTENPPALSPASEIHSQASGASNFWKTLFEEDASIRTKRDREDSPKSEVKQQGRESFHPFL